MTASPPPREPSPRRRQLLDAGVHVIATRGLRGLTHRAVDRQAGVAEGSCSAYLRTRRALLAALTEHVAGALAADVEELAGAIQACSGDGDRSIDLTHELFRRWLDEREVLLAQLELSLEASRDPALAALLGTWRARLVEVVTGITAARGRERSTARAETLVSSFDGVLLAALRKPPAARQEFLAASLDLLMRPAG